MTSSLPNKTIRIFALLFSAVPLLGQGSFSSSPSWSFPFESLFGARSQTNISGSNFQAPTTAPSSFDNLFSRIELSSTAVEFRKVKCRQVTKSTEWHAQIANITVSEVTLVRASNLVRQIDELQYSLCLKMLSKEYSDKEYDDLVEMMGQELVNQVKWARDLSEHLAKATSESQLLSIVDQGEKQLKQSL